MENDLLENLTIIVPTFNRNYYLSRLLYYLNVNSFHNLIVTDSSEPEKRQINEEMTKSLYEGRATYIWSTENEYGSKFYEKILSAIEKVETSYVTLCGDKDFPIIPGLRDCIKYLDENQDYHVADGKYYSFQPDYSKKKLFWRKAYIKKETIFLDSPLSRIENLIRIYQPLCYSIHRTETLYDAISKTREYTNDARFGELFSGAIPLSQGKYAHLDVNYWCRESNPSQSGSFRLPKMNDYWNNGTYNTKYKRFKEGLNANLPDYSLEKINAVIDSAMESYMRRVYPQLFNKNTKKTPKDLVKLPLKYLSPSQKMKLFEYYKRVNIFHRDNTSWESDLPPEIKKVEQFLMETMDNNAYLNDLPICNSMEEKD